MLCMETISALLCSIASASIYLNSIAANFAFDDNFAVINNADVTRDATPLRDFWVHDFWGQRISSPQSHKSYRPLTVLLFRLLRHAWRTLPAAWREAVVARRTALQRQYETNEAAARGLDPLPYHICNVVLHAVVSTLVCRLSYTLLRQRWRPQRLLVVVPAGDIAPPAGRQHMRLCQTDDAEQVATTVVGRRYRDSSPQGPHPRLVPDARACFRGDSDAEDSEDSSCPRSSSTTCGLRRRPGRAVAQVAVGHRTGSSSTVSCLTGAPSTNLANSNYQPSSVIFLSWARLHAPACVAGLAFALHPIHTEAVAGIVGAAELLSAALALSAILLYLAAAERAVAARTEVRGLGWTLGSVAAHWAAVGAAVILAFAAALAKEIGITVLGTMLIADVLLVPVVVVARWASYNRRWAKLPSTSRTSVSFVGRSVAGATAARAAWRKCRNALHVFVCLVLEEPKWGRMALLVGCGFGYVRLRSWVAGDQLVRIYRKVENPIPFSASRADRLLSTAYLHARYVGLLLAPVHLSADWSFNCIPLVTSLYDVRNLAAAALYGMLAWIVLSAAPWEVLGLWRRAAVAAAAPAYGEDGCMDEQRGTAAAAAEEEKPGKLDEDELHEEKSEPWDATSSQTFVAADNSHSAGEPVAWPSEKQQLLLPDQWVPVREENVEDETARERPERLWVARWRLVVVMGLCVGPFLPASNVFFYVGTFIGERLLYFPSIGFCLLLAELAARVLIWAQQASDPAVAPLTSRITDAPASSTGITSDSATANNGAIERTAVPATAAVATATATASTPITAEAPATATEVYPAINTDGIRQRRGRRSNGVGWGCRPHGRARRATPSISASRWTVAKVLTYGCMAAVLFLYGVRTWRRNYDWRSEEALFEAAHKVCPTSAKVQLNMGILQRRRGQLDAALTHFRAARSIEPEYCEPGYWLGITLVNMGDPESGLLELEGALGCKYVATEALSALHTVFRTVHGVDPESPGPVMRWGLVLLRPELSRLSEGCGQIEHAALLYAQRGEMQEAAACLQRGAAVLLQREEEEASGQSMAPQPRLRVPAGLGAPAAGSEGRLEEASGTGSVFPRGEKDAAPSPRQLLACLEARRPVYFAIARRPHAPMHRRVRAAVYRYVRQLDSMPYCRGGADAAAVKDVPTAQAAFDGGDEMVDGTELRADLVGGGWRGESGMGRQGAGKVEENASMTPAHMYLLHTVQKEDPQDPWLQAEWGRALRAVGRYGDAVVHLSVAAALLNQQLARLQAGQSPNVHSLASAATEPLNTIEALEGIARALAEAAALSPPNRCDLWVQVTEARWLLAGLAGRGGDLATRRKQMAAAMAAAHRLEGLAAVCSVQWAAVTRLLEGILNSERRRHEQS